MLFRIPSPNKVVRIATIATLSFMVCWGLVMVVVQIKPFWVDEWRIIYNLKYKDAAALWGPLDFMQQFPRVYLEIVKAFTSLFNYNYFALRVPSFIVGTATILFCYRLMKKIYPADNGNRFLFIMILVSSYTFTEYFVQIKQYTMDIFLSLVAIWQLLEMLKLGYAVSLDKKRYLLLCLSFLVCPFFSYTYPVAIAPVFVIVFLQSIDLLKNKSDTSYKRILFLQWLPLLLSFSSIVCFYILDVSQLMQDRGMQVFWKNVLMNHGFSWQLLLLNCYNLFAEVGSGLVFSIVFGILGIFSFSFGIYKCVNALMNNRKAQYPPLILYASVLLVIVIALFISGKFPLGESRLNAFTVPSISMLIIYFLDFLKQKSARRNFSLAVSALLYLGVTGNIYTTCYAAITGPVYAHKMAIYTSTENAITYAQANNLSIIITPGVAYPYDKTQNLPFKNTVPGDWVLKTFPAYQVFFNTPVYALRNLAELEKCMQQLPPSITSVLVGDGVSFKVMHRYN